MLIQILSAALATLASIVDTSAAQAPMRAVIVCDATRLAAAPRVIDLHDFTGHHRYYGRSAC